MVRRIRISDAASIKAICETVFGYQTTTEQIEQQILMLTEDDHYYVAVFEDDFDAQVKGFIQAQRYSILYGENGWNIMSLTISEKYQHQGLAERLSYRWKIMRSKIIAHFFASIQELSERKPISFMSILVFSVPKHRSGSSSSWMIDLLLISVDYKEKRYVQRELINAQKLIWLLTGTNCRKNRYIPSGIRKMGVRHYPSRYRKVPIVSRCLRCHN